MDVPCHIDDLMLLERKKKRIFFYLFRISNTPERQRLTNEFDSDDDPISINKNNPVCLFL